LNELNTVTPLPRTFKHFTNKNDEDIRSENSKILSVSDSFNDKLKKFDFESFWEKLESLKNFNQGLTCGNICHFHFNILI
jgi:hypothetical protein